MRHCFYFTAVLLLLFSFSSCTYHSREAVRYPPPRPTYRAPADFVIKPQPNELPSVPYTSRTLKSDEGLIVIDAGHGGDDFGTKSASTPKYHEKSLNLITSLILSDYLQKQGYRVMMTRYTDTFISLQKRAEIANEKNADLFISVHYNSAPVKKAEGIEVFYYKDDEDASRAKESRKLATAVLAKVLKMTDARSRGVKQGNFAVIRETKMPAILIEGGFLSSESEMEKIKDPSYVKSIAWGIAQGIQSYMEAKANRS